MIDDDVLADVEDIYPLSPLQLGMLFQTRLAPHSGVFLQQTATPLPRVDDVFFEKAWQALIEATPALRTSFHWADLEHPVQLVRRHVPFTVAHLDWTRLPARSVMRRMHAHLADSRAKGFDLETAPLTRVELVSVAGGHQWFLWHFHHILLDGWSSQLVLDELIARYTSLLRGEPFRAPTRPPFSAYIDWLQRQDEGAVEAFWRRTLRGFAAPTPLGLAAASPHPHSASDVHEHTVEYSIEATSALTQFARTNRVTLNTVVQGAWGLLLSRYSGENDVVFGSVVAGRRPEIAGVEDIIGLFINSLPTRVVIDDDQELSTYLREVQTRQSDAMHFDYASPMQISQWSELPAGTRVYDSVLIFENLPTTTHPPVEIGQQSAVPLDFGQTDLPLSVMVVPGARLRFVFRSNGGTLDPESVRGIASHLIAILDRFPASGAIRLGSIPMMPNSEHDFVVREVNQTSTDGWCDETVVSLLAEAVGRAPDDLALTESDGTAISFRSLDQLSGRLANLLRSRSVRAGDVVGVQLPRSIDAVASVLAVLKTGAAFLPLDPAYPRFRLDQMVTDSRAVAVVTRGSLAEPVESALVVDLDVLAGDLDRMDSQCPSAGVGPDDLAYVMFTSGSTGVPKGAAVEHRTVLNRLWWMWRAFPFEVGEVGVVRTSANFVDATWEVLGPLLQGVPSVIASNDVVADPDAFLDLAAEHGVTRLFLVPSYLDALLTRCPDVADRVPRLKTWFVGGEPLTGDLSRRFSLAVPDGRLFNIYGSTELWDVTVCAANGQVPAGDLVSIGHPIDNVRTYILDAGGRPVPRGVAGRLHVAGAGLARGYLDERMTRERFAVHQIDDKTNELLFDTGDIARRGADGSIQVLGRSDNQVKVRGVRVEPAEVESAMERHTSVAEAAVVFHPSSRTDGQLVAYAVPTCDEIDEPALRVFLGSLLPTQMVPSRFVWVDSIPRTPSGKKDRKELLARPLDQQPRSRALCVEAHGEIESVIMTAMADVVGCATVARDDNFFGDLGGHSLLAVRLCSRLETTLGVDVPLRDVFDFPTAELLAVRLGPSIAARGNADTESLLRELEALDDDEIETILASLDGTAEVRDD